MAFVTPIEVFLEVHDGDKTLKLPIRFHERHKIGTKSDLLARALGPTARARARSIDRLLVVDATAGLCRDSMHLLALGCEVIAIERNEKLYEVYSQLVPPENFQLIHADAIEWLRDCAQNRDESADSRPDIVFLDPMFPEKKKSAAVSKETRVLQLLETPPMTEEEVQLLKAAQAAAKDRVIVKRPKHAPPLAQTKPSHSHFGKAVRYDVYVMAKPKSG